MLFVVVPDVYFVPVVRAVVVVVVVVVAVAAVVVPRVVKGLRVQCFVYEQRGPKNPKSGRIFQPPALSYPVWSECEIFVTRV